MKLSLLIINILFGFSVFGQVIWTEDFDTGSSARGTLANGYPATSGGNWTQTNNVLGGGEGASANQWYVSGEECGNAVNTCGSVCSNGDGSLHVSAIGGLCGTPDCGAAYNATNASNITDKRIESPNINTVGFGGLTLSFNYIAAQDDDRVFPYYSCNGGATWIALPLMPATQCCSCLDAFVCGFFGICCAPQTQQSCASGGQGYWTARNYALPVCAENITNLKIAFHWINDGDGAGSDPSIAIDDMSITSTIPLAVDMIDLNVVARNNQHVVQWKTLTEENNDYFEIEHSLNGTDFNPIGTIKGAGNSTELISYEFIDRVPSLGDNYYRLKQVDRDNTITISKIIHAYNNSTASGIVKIYPNPAKEIVSIEYNSIKEIDSRYIVLDNLGRQIDASAIHFEKGINTIALNIQNYTDGSYFLRIIDGENVSIQRFMVTK